VISRTQKNIKAYVTELQLNKIQNYMTDAQMTSVSLIRIGLIGICFLKKAPLHRI
jgi:hypothetical protein